MTKRERYLKALRGGQVDGLVWAPNLDYWLKVNSAEGTLPSRYVGMSRNETVNAIGGTLWNRVGGLKTVVDAGVKETVTESGGKIIRELSTPVGSIRSVTLETEGDKRTRFLAEHFVKDLDSLRVMKYVVEATHYEPDYEPIEKAHAETGEDGIVLNMTLCVPFIQFAKTDAGYENGLYMWMDHREEVDSLIDAHFRNFLQGYKVLADGPADLIATNDNMDGLIISPDIFREYAIPFYREAKKIISAGGKPFQGHWCGRTQTLLPLVPGCGLDVVEAIVTRPMADISLAEALDILGGQVVLQGGIPAVIVCEEWGGRDEFKKYIEEVILPLKGRKGFILGMSDNVPPNADFTRVETVADLIA